MTEAEWLANDSPYLMLQFVRHRASKRKLRLYACACCRQVWNLMLDVRSRKAVEVSEKYADGLASKEEMSAAQGEASAAVQVASQKKVYPLPKVETTWFKGQLVFFTKHGEAAKAAKAAARSTDRFSTMTEEMSQASGWALNAEAIGHTVSEIHEFRKRYSNLLRCIFGNPFRPVVAFPTWLTHDALVVAQTIYDNRAFTKMPALANALERTRCEDQEILSHCMNPSEHAMGCWVVDLVLGKR